MGYELSIIVDDWYCDNELIDNYYLILLEISKNLKPSTTLQ